MAKQATKSAPVKTKTDEFEEEQMPSENLPATTGGDVPSFLAEMSDEDKKAGLDEASQYQSTPLAKVIHPTALASLQDEHGVGSCIVGGRLLIGFGEKVRANVLFFWPSWQHRRDNADSHADGFIIEETFDPNHEIAVTSRNPKLRNPGYKDDPKKFYTYCESLNYIVQTVEESNNVPKGTVFAVKWSLGGNKCAKRLNSYVSGVGVPLYANVIDLEVVKAKNTANEWFQLDWSLAEAKHERFITQEMLLPSKDKHESLKLAHSHRQLGTQSEADEAAGE